MAETKEQPMKLEHAALYVDDLEAEKDFFIKYFGATANALYHNPKTNFKSYFLKFEEGARLEIMTRPELIRPFDNTLDRRGFAHIAFSLGSKGAVDALTARLKADGYAVLGGPRTTGDGYYESSIADAEGNVIEITG